MSKTPYMPLWVSDFLGDTLDLDAKEVGSYILLLMAMWQRGGTLPDDQAKLKRVARIGRDWPRVWASIERYFEAKNGVITNKRLSQELHIVNTKREVNARSGARGGRAKALKSKERTLANASNSLKHPYPYSEIKKKETNVSQKELALSPTEKYTGNGFDEFWAACPRKVGKGEAEKRYKMALKEATPAVLISAMRRYANEREGKDKKYTVHPERWLSRKRWLDEYEPQTNFHDRVEEMINGLPGQDEVGNGGAEQISTPVRAALTSQRRGQAGKAAPDRGVDQSQDRGGT